MRRLCDERIEREESRMSDEPKAQDLPTIDAVLGDPSASFWLKTALHSALCRDPVDAAHDSAVLAGLLKQRCDEILKAS
jgi:hypothetical protein